jgi:hypothetical protein
MWALMQMIRVGHFGLEKMKILKIMLITVVDTQTYDSVEEMLDA